MNMCNKYKCENIGHKMIAWIANMDLPQGGFPTAEVTMDDLLKNQDFPKPQNWNNQKKIEQKVKRGKRQRKGKA